jgi:arabinosyltransferase C
MQVEADSTVEFRAPRGEARAIGAVERSEYRFALAVAAGVMAVTCLPYVLCWYATPPGGVFAGVLANADDHGVYLAWMRQARDGHFCFRNLFTNEPQSGRYVHLYFWLLGSLARVTGLSLPLADHLGRCLAGIATLLLAYRLGAFFTSDRFTRRVILWTTACSSGLGWLFWLPHVSQRSPVDAWQPEAFTFQSLYMNGLFAVSLALMLGVVIGLLLADLHRRSRYAVAAGLCGLLLANIHTYDTLTLAVVWAGYLLAALCAAPREFARRLGHALLAGLVAAPGLAYEVWYYRSEQVFQQRVAVPTLSPPFRLYLWGYGLLLPLAAYGAWLLLRRARLRETPHLLLPPVWAAVGLALPYLPVTYQRKLVMGEHLPLALLAGIGIAGLVWLLWPPGTPVVRRILAGAVIALTAVTPVRYMLRDVELAMEKNVTTTSVHPVWWPASDFAAMNWMSEHLPPDAVILAYPIGAVFMPAVTDRTVYAGHWGETPGFTKKMDQVTRFYSGTDPTVAGPVTPGRPVAGGYSASNAASPFLYDAGVTHVFYGTPEHALVDRARDNGYPGFDPSNPALGLREVYRQGETAVYEVPR